MPSLKNLKNRIKSVKNTQKITKAMKMVAAAKLRRAKEHAEAARPYSEKMAQIVQSLASGAQNSGNILLSGTGKDHTHLILVATSDRGLCGAFNGSIIRAARRKIQELLAQGKDVKIFCVGKKGADALSGEHGRRIVARITEISKKKQIPYSDADHIAKELLRVYSEQQIDVVHLVYNQFKSAISQVVTWQQLIPLPVSATPATQAASTPYEYEPSEEAILADLLPRNLGVQIYHALLENAASEQGARMSAMDNATRNAGQMIGKLTLTYNRTRQAAITKELIEIISGAEAL